MQKKLVSNNEDKNQTNLIEYEKQMQNEKFIVEIQTIEKLLQENQITIKYAQSLLKNIIENKDFKNVEEKNELKTEVGKALKYLCIISEKDKELFEYLEFIVISEVNLWISLYALILLALHFPKKSKPIIKHYFKKKHTYLIETISGIYKDNYYRYWELKEFTKLVENPILKIYLHYKWFFDKYHLVYISYTKRIYGSYKLFHGNLRIKIQCYSSPRAIFNKFGGQRPIEILKEFDLSYLDKREKKMNKVYTNILKRKIGVVNVYPINEKFFYGISLRIFNKLILATKKLFGLDNKDYFFYLIKNNTIVYVYVDIPVMNLEMVLPAKKVKKD